MPSGSTASCSTCQAMTASRPAYRATSRLLNAVAASSSDRHRSGRISVPSGSGSRSWWAGTKNSG